MRIFGTIISNKELVLLIGVLCVAAGVIIGVAATIQRSERDKLRLTDGQAIMNALEIYRTLYGVLPDTTENDCEGWDAGSSVRGEDNTFIQQLADKNVLNAPREVFGISKCAYRYQKFTNNGCGSDVSYALVGLKLENTKKAYHVNDVIEPCYPDIYRWTSDPHWIAFMIRE
ncbi:MAG: hypothetical protein AAB400_00580 [Patescibacteria group bacterium]